MEAAVGSAVSLLLTFLVGILVARWLLKVRKLPPGPWGLPVVGYIPFLRKTFLEQQFKKLTDKHGKIFGFFLGQQYVVVLSSYDVIKEALVKQGDNFAGRPNSINHLTVFNDFKSVIITEGEVWKDQRRFLISTLRDFGLGKLSIEGKIQEEAQVALNLLRDGKVDCRGLPFLYNCTTTNVICSICFGHRFDHGSTRLRRLQQLMDETERVLQQAGLLDAFPLLSKLPASWTKLDQVLKIREELISFIDEQIEEHIETFDSNNPRDVTDVYLQRRKQLRLDSNSDDSQSIFSRRHMSINLTILFFAGTDTTSTTLYWGTKLMAMYPDIQKKVQQEIDKVVGRSRLPSWNDRNNLPFTEATLLEIHRIASIIPLGVVHSNLEEAVVEGFTIPKRSYILMNIWQVHNDPNLWNNPEKFDPTRFLNSEGKLIKSEHVLPFSTGKRICLGESLARMELLIFFASIFQNFNFVYEGKEPLELDFESGIIRKVSPFDARIEPR